MYFFHEKKSIQGNIGKFLENFRKFKIIKGNLGMTNKFSEFIQFFVKKRERIFFLWRRVSSFLFYIPPSPLPCPG